MSFINAKLDKRVIEELPKFIINETENPSKLFTIDTANSMKLTESFKCLSEMIRNKNVIIKECKSSKKYITVAHDTCSVDLYPGSEFVIFNNSVLILKEVSQKCSTSIVCD